MDIDASMPAVSFTLRQLECFVAVAEAGSISAAATLLRASDSAVADAVSALERAVGTTLLVRRRSQGVFLTSDGRSALAVAQRVLIEAHELFGSVGGDGATLAGSVRVGAPSTLAPVYLPALIDEVKQSHPKLSVDFVMSDQPELIRSLDRGDLDAAIVFDIDVPPELPREPIARTVAQLVVDSSHRLANNTSVDLREIADEPMVLLDIAPSRMHTLELMSTAGITPHIAYRTEDYELCRSLVGRGFGYSLLMRRHLSTATWDRHHVVSIPIVPEPRQVDVMLLWARTRTPRLAALIDAARALRTTTVS